MIEKFVKEKNLPNFRIDQFNQKFFREYVTGFDQITTWPKELREMAKKELNFFTFDFEKETISKDRNTIKVLLKRKEDQQRIEAVLMKHRDGRNTVCVSCMVGCPVNCSFCATGKMGFGGNLSSEEIVDQVLYFQRQLVKKGQKVTNIVFMGMGEPMLNLVNVMKAIEVFTDPKKMGLSTRRLTVSTSGYVPQLKRLIKSGYMGRIAISLHAPNQELREKMMPVAKIFSLKRLLNTLDEYVEKTNKRVTYEYILIRGVNDQPEHAKELSKLFEKRLAHINLIPYNPIKGVKFKRTDSKGLRDFTTILANRHIHYTVRQTMGDDANAACGQLADAENKKNKLRKITIN